MRVVMIKSPAPKEKWTKTAVKELRERYGETQLRFAERFGASVETIRAWEQGKRPVSGMASVILDQLEESLAAKMG